MSENYREALGRKKAEILTTGGVRPLAATMENNSRQGDMADQADGNNEVHIQFKGGLFKRNTKGKLKFYEPRRTKVEIKHTNPYFENKHTDAFFYQDKDKKTYGQGLLKGGVIGGITAALLILLL